MQSHMSLVHVAADAGWEERKLVLQIGWGQVNELVSLCLVGFP